MQPVMTDAAAIAYLRSPRAIRDRCQQLFDLAGADQLTYFRCDLNQLDAVAAYVLAVIQADYPDLDVPFHSRWRHFEVGSSSAPTQAGQTPRLQALEARLAPLAPVERAYVQFDLAMISVLLDAGAGPDWRYTELGSGEQFQRSEGLAVASFHMFCQGLFSSQPDRPLQVDAIALQNLTEASLAAGFQVSTGNPLVGLAGRVQLLQKLGWAIAQHPHLFGQAPARPGHLVDYLLRQTIEDKQEDKHLPASIVLQAILEGLSDIWPGRLAIAGVNLGDVWEHSALGSGLYPSDSFVPFHKLSQWLTYSLLEPLQQLGLEITDLDALTGLPEYRNGGLCLDLGLLQIKDPALLEVAHAPSSELIVEWRALTIILLDHIAHTLRQHLGLTAQTLPLVKVLQGGTWTAGRKIAAQLRPNGPPPLKIISDGTVF